MIAGNQSYFFPYLGYFQLINAVDKFNLYDNLNFISRGWVNRNNILLNNGNVFMITVPLANRSSFIKIRDLEIDDLNGSMKWRHKICKTIYDNYKRALMFGEMYPFLESLIHHPTKHLSELNSNSVIQICKYLSINTTIETNPDIYQHIESLLLNEKYISENYGNLETKEIRLIEICRFEKADTIYNSIGGTSFYSKDKFGKYGVNVRFLKMKEIAYKQHDNPFVPNLSIIDVLMFNSRTRVQEMLREYELI